MNNGRIAVGPGLVELLEAQKLTEDILSWPLLEHYANRLSVLQRALPGRPVVWPVDAAAERLAGAAAMVGGSGFRMKSWGQLVRGEPVLVAVVVALGPLALVQAAAHARALGAATVVGCGAEVRTMDEIHESLDDFVVLTPPDAWRRSA